jgi:hypothetical protein
MHELNNELIGVCGHQIIVCPNGKGDPFACNSFCGLCEGEGDYCDTCEGKPIRELFQRRCECAKPDALGRHVVDDAGISFGGLKQAQNEASRDAAQYIAHIYFTKSEKIFNRLMEMITDNPNANVFGGYRETCEWLANEG